MTYSSFQDMSVWKKANNLSVRIFELTIKLPRSEDYGLTSQIRRSSNSVSGNISEGFGRKTSRDKNNFYTISRGSAFETQNHLIYGNKVGYFSNKDTNELIIEYDELIKELNKLMKSLINSHPQPRSLSSVEGQP